MKRIIGIPFSKNKTTGGDKKEGQAPAPPVAPPPPEGSLTPQAPPQSQLQPEQQQQLTSIPSQSKLPPTKQPGWFSRLTKKKPQPELPELITKADAKVEDWDRKIAQCETELKAVSLRLRNVSEGATKNSLKAKAQGIIQRKKRYEQLAEGLRQQSFNLEQTNATIQSTKEAVNVVAALQKGVKELKKEQKKVNLESVEDLHDEMEQLFEQSEEVQDVFANNLNMPMIDDKELEEQLELLGQDYVADEDASYLDEIASKRNADSFMPTNFVTRPLSLPGSSIQNTDPESANKPNSVVPQPPKDSSADLNDILYDGTKLG